MTLYVIGYFAIGLALAIYADWEQRDFQKNNPAAAFGLTIEISTPTRIMNDVLAFFFWPLILLKKVLT